MSASSRSRPTRAFAYFGRFEFGGSSSAVGRKALRSVSRKRSAGGVNGTSRAVTMEIVRPSRHLGTSRIASAPVSSSASSANRLIAAIPAPDATASFTASHDGSSSVRTA
jgi:hypothetical protein